MKDLQGMGKNILYTSGNLVMEVSSDVLVDAGFQTGKAVNELMACASLQLQDENMGVEVQSPMLKNVQEILNGRSKLSPITGLIASTVGCTIEAANSEARLLAINVGDRAVDLVSIPGQFGHDVRVISYKNAGKIAKIAIRTHNNKGEEVGLQLDVRVVAAVRSLPDLALSAAGGVLELTQVAISEGNDKGFKVLVNGISSGITFAKETALVVIDIPVTRATALLENGFKAIYNTLKAGYCIGKLAVLGGWADDVHESADCYVLHRSEAAKQVFYSIGSAIGGRSADQIDADIKQAMNE